MNAIDNRKSVRNFQKTPLLDIDVEKIYTYINNAENSIGPYGNQIKFKLLLDSELNKNEKIGTYGVIHNAQGYLLGSCINTPHAVFDFGVVFEGLLLHLTSIGIGTCWLAGTFKRQEILQYFPVAEDEFIPAITPLGYAMDNMHFQERVMRQFIKADRRKAENDIFFYEHFKQALDNKGEIFKQAVHYVRIAPSAKNIQPWRIVVSKDFSKVHFYFVNMLTNDKSFACPSEILDLGISYRHFVVGMDEVGIKGQLIQNEPEIQKPVNVEYICTWQRN